jgi:hypothetical protein
MDRRVKPPLRSSESLSLPDNRDWRLISLTHEEGNFNQLRAQLGNNVAINAYREGKRPFPDGAIIVALHWNRAPRKQVYAGVHSGFKGTVASLETFCLRVAEQ